MKKTILFTLIMMLFVSLVSAGDLNITSIDTLTANYNEGQVTGTFVVKNIGTTNETSISFSDKFEGSSNISVTYNPSSFNLNINDSISVNMTVSVTTQKAETYSLDLTQSSHNLTGSKSSTLVINSLKNVSITPVSTVKMAKGQTKTVNITLTNNGNTDFSESCSLSTPADFTNPSSTFSIKYGKSSNCLLTFEHTGAVAGVFTFNVSAGAYAKSSFSVDVSEETLVLVPESESDVIDVEKKNEYSFTIENRGTTSRNLTMEIFGLEDEDYDEKKIELKYDNKVYDFDDLEDDKFKLSNKVIPGNSQQVVKLTLDYSDEDDGAAGLEESTDEDDYIYPINFVFTEGSTQVEKFDLNLTLEGNKIEVQDDPDVYVNGKNKKDDPDVSPGDNLKIILVVENKLGDVSLSNIRIESFIDKLDDGDEFELDDVDGGYTIKAGKEEKIELELKVPYIVDEKSYSITLDIEAEDEYGNLYHLEEEEFKVFTVDKDKNAMTIGDDGIEPEEVDCVYPSFRYEAELYNTGKEEEEGVKYTAEIVGYSEYKVTETFDIDEEDSQGVSTNFNLDKLEEGEYTFSVEVEYDEQKKSTSKDYKFNLVCGSKTDSKTDDTNDKGTTTPDDTFKPDFNTDDLFKDDSSSETVKETGDSFEVFILVGLIIIVLIAIVILLFKLFAR